MKQLLMQFTETDESEQVIERTLSEEHLEEVRKYRYKQWEYREKLKLQEHLDNFRYDPEAMKRKERRRKQWQAFCDATRTSPVGYIEKPLHEVIAEYSDCFPKADLVNFQDRLTDTMQWLQKHKLKIGFITEAEYIEWLRNEKNKRRDARKNWILSLKGNE